MKYPYFLLLLVVLVSCRSHSAMPIMQRSDSTSYIQKNELQNSKFLIHHSHSRDSVIYRERTIHDTVYITKEVFRDALNSKFLIQNSAKTDTVVVTEYRDKIIERPPERYVPKFYIWCTMGLWILVILLVGYRVIKWRLRL